MGDLGSIPWLARSPGEGNGNPLQYSCLKNAKDFACSRRCLVGYSPKDSKEYYMTEQFFFFHFLGFPDSSVGKESTCSAGFMDQDDPVEKG